MSYESFYECGGKHEQRQDKMQSGSKLFKPNLSRAVLCLAAVVPLLFAGAGDLVLCFGENGHVAVEFAHRDPCHSSKDRPDEAPAGSRHGTPGNHCCSCFDIPVTFENADQHPIDNSIHKITGLLARGPAHFDIIAAPETGSDAEILLQAPPPPFRTSLASLRTTVLLI